MKKVLIYGAIALIAGTSGAAAADVNKTYMRKGDQEIRVFTHEGLLYCRRTSDDFEMCHGMAEAGAGTFKGDKMKHPDMPQFMTFDGTVVIGGNKKLSIEGCMIGGAMCDKEFWDEQ
ncbi:MAG: hypothetical protein KDK00_09060 [Rhodobacteraceae bacterium]|nr:hypothetical protein [Paracoccaceae bacterium]